MPIGTYHVQNDFFVKSYACVACRKNSVEFYNMLLEKYDPSKEKITIAVVVHPGGRKFLWHMIFLVKITLKEVMRRRKINPNQSLNIEKTREVVSKLNEIHNNVNGIMKDDLKLIKDKTTHIQELINVIYPQDQNSIPFEEFIENWHSLNKIRLEKIQQRDAMAKEVVEKSEILQENARKMLKNKNFKIEEPTADQIKELAEFYQDIEVPMENHFNIASLLLYLESTLPIIREYIKSFSYDEVEISHEEMKIVKEKLVELQRFQPLIKKLTEKQNKLKEKVSKVLTEKAERENVTDEGNQTVQDEEKILKEAHDREMVQLLLSPKHKFTTTKSNINSIKLRKNHLIFAEDEGAFNADHSVTNFNRSIVCRPPEIKLNKTRDVEFPKPQQTNKPPSRRRRRDAFQLMEQALSSSNASNKNKIEQQSNTGAIPKFSSTPFSSTMLSPDLINHANANFSMISNISSVVQTPVTSLQPKNSARHNQFNTFLRPDVLSKQHQYNAVEIEQIITKTTAMSLVDETLCNPVPLSVSSENEFCEKENFGWNVESETVFFRKHDEEDLLNVSDTVLIDD